MPELSHSFVKVIVVLLRPALQTTCDNCDKQLRENVTCPAYVFHRFHRFHVQLHAASSFAAANTLF